MNSGEPTICAMLLFCLLPWSINAASPQSGYSAGITLAAAHHLSLILEPQGDEPARRCDQHSENSPTDKRKAPADLPAIYRYWLNEDVVYIIPPEERCAFLERDSDQQRDIFIEQFWYQRNPDPTSQDNAFRDEHYRRIVFSNEKFATEIPGWQTDRGHVYIRYGPPDSVVSHPAAELTWKPPEGEQGDVRYSWEDWRYRLEEGLEPNINFAFVDPSGSGESQLRLGPKQKDLPIFDPPATFQDDQRRPTLADGRLHVFIGPGPVPLIHYKDLEALAVSGIIRHQILFAYRIRFVRATNASTMTTISVDLPAHPAEDEQAIRPTDSYEIFARISTPYARAVHTFESHVEVAHPLLYGADRETTVPLTPGPYDLALVVKVSGSGQMGVLHTTFQVPRFEDLSNQE
jgi:GWxTD domain-containing protein